MDRRAPDHTKFSTPPWGQKQNIVIKSNIWLVRTAGERLVGSFWFVGFNFVSQGHDLAFWFEFWFAYVGTQGEWPFQPRGFLINFLRAISITKNYWTCLCAQCHPSHYVLHLIWASQGSSVVGAIIFRSGFYIWGGRSSEKGWNENKSTWGDWQS
jgi:hypothetical protein